MNRPLSKRQESVNRMRFPLATKNQIGNFLLSYSVTLGLRDSA
jgi:hypothetical protein